MLPEKYLKILRRDKYMFVSVSTSDLKGNPNSAFKLLVKCEGNYLYIFDYPAWRTWKNLKENPKISISFMDDVELKNYKINGTVEIIEKGPFHDKMRDDIEQKRTDITVKHIVESVQKEKDYRIFESEMTKKFVLYQIKVTKLHEMTFAKTPKI